MSKPSDRADGFSLVELLVALALIVVVTASAAQLALFAAKAVSQSRTRTIAGQLATERIEQLRSELSLTASPSGTLSSNVSGYVDFLDRHGRPLTETTAGPVFVRRWRVSVSPQSANVLVLQVAVLVLAGRAVDAAPAFGDMWAVSTRRTVS